MAIADGLKVQVYPQAGDTAIKNIVDNSNFTVAAGSAPTLSTDGGTPVWLMAADTFLKKAIASKILDASADGNGITIALRFKRTTTGTNTYMDFGGVSTSGGAANSGVRFTGFDGNTYRGRASGGANTNTAVIPTAVANGNILTLVYRFSTLAASSSAPNMDSGAIWQNRVGRIGTAPDALTYGNANNITITDAMLNCQTGAAWTLFDFSYFDTGKPDADCAAIADDYRGVMPAPSSSTPVSFSGTVNNQTATVGTAFNLALASFFSGSLTPFTYSLVAGSLTGTGLSLNASTGAITGTPTGAATISGLQVRATDTASNTAQTNAFSITVAASATPVNFTGTVPAITGTAGTAIAPVNLSTYFAGSLTPFTYSVFSGSLPTGLSLNSSTGVISGTPTGASSGSVVVRATDTGSNAANTNSFAVTIAAAAVPSFTLTDLANNANAPWASTANITVDVYNPSTGALVVRKTGLTSTAGADLVVSDAALVAATTYNVFITIGTAIGAVKATAA
jgi:hypothetical protein